VRGTFARPCLIFLEQSEKKYRQGVQSLYRDVRTVFEERDDTMIFIPAFLTMCE